MDLKMEVYTPSLELIGLLEIQRSVIWEEKAFSAGSFSIESLITDEAREMLEPENIIWIEGNTAGIIEYVNQASDETGPYISVKGRTLTGILGRRILWGLYNLSGTVQDIMRRLVDDCCIHPTRGNAENRQIPGLVLTNAPTGGTSIRIQKTGGTLLEALEELGEAYQVAFGVRFNPEVPQMEFWASPGIDRSAGQTVNEPVFYSTELDDVLSSEYSYNSGDYRNAALVAGEGEGNDRVMITVEELVDPEPVKPPEPPETDTYTISLAVDPAGGGLASGGGSFDTGETATVTAAPASGYSFAGWRENGEIVSTNAAYSFPVTSDRDLTAVFAASGVDCNIVTGVDPAGAGTVTGGGTYTQGDTVTLHAAPSAGYQFAAWKENSSIVSTSTTYTFTANSSRSLTAVFEAVPSGRLPAGYTEVEYIQNGTSQIQGYIPYIKMPAVTSAVKFAIKFSCAQTTSQGSIITTVYGYKSSGTTQYGICIYNNQKVRYYTGGTTSFKNLSDYTAETIYDIEFDSTAKTVVVNGTSLSATTGTYWRTALNYLFGQHNNNYVTNSVVRAKAYYVKMWDADGNLLLEFVPCIDPAGAIGMYDVVGGKFYGNSNTSTNSNNKFIAGPAV